MRRCLTWRCCGDPLATTMRVQPSAVSVMVVVVGICWLGARQLEIHDLRDEIAALKGPQRAATAFAAQTRDGGGRAGEPPRTRMRRLTKELGPPGGIGWLRTDWDEMDELAAMSRDELIALLDAIAETDGVNARLEEKVLTALERIDPEYVTRRTYRPSALAAWALVDPAGAVAWFEEQVAAGNFQSKRAGAGEFEGQLPMRKSLAWALGASDPAAARRLIGELPVENRAAIFRKDYWGVGWSMRAENLPVMAGLMRTLVPDEKQPELVASPFWEQGDFGETGVLEDWRKLESYFADIQATGDEREAVVLAMSQSARFPRESGGYFKTSPEDIDALRSWVAKENPALVTEATALALATVANRREQDFAPWVDYALRLHAAGAGDEVLVAVLETHRTPQHPELARAMAERLSPGEERERFLQQLDRAEP